MDISWDIIKIICKYNPLSFYQVNKEFRDYYIKINESAEKIQKIYRKWINNKKIKNSGFYENTRMYIPYYSFYNNSIINGSELNNDTVVYLELPTLVYHQIRIDSDDDDKKKVKRPRILSVKTERTKIKRLKKIPYKNNFINNKRKKTFFCR